MALLIFLAALFLVIGVAMSSPIDFSKTTIIDFDSQPANLMKRSQVHIHIVAINRRLFKLVVNSHNSFATTYYQEGGTGSCGHKHQDSDGVVSIAQHCYDKYGKKFLCGRKMKVKNTGHYTDNSIGGKGNVIYPKIADTCSACTSDTAHVDLSIGAWDRLTNNAALSNVKVLW